MSAARIGMVTQWYDPERGSAAQPGIISRSLLRRGHRVDVVTGFPNYPSGHLYPGYAVRPYLRETIGGVTVHRVPLYPSHDTNPVRRATNYLSFSAAASVTATWVLRDADAVLVHSTPATVAIPAVVLRVLRRKPYVVHVQDLWPQTVVSSGFVDDARAGRMERALHVYCDAVYRRAAAIAVTSPGMAPLIAERGVSEDKIVFVPNWADEASFRPVERDPALAAALGITAAFTVMYAGNFGEFQALDVVVEAADRLHARSDIGFALVGGGVEEARLRRMVAERGLANVTFVGPQPFERMAGILALGDVQLVTLQDVPLFRTTLPSKLQGVLAAGRPVIAAVTGDAAAVVRESGAGEVVRPGSSEELADAVLALAATPSADLTARGTSGRAYYAGRFSEQVVGDRLSALLERAAEQGRAAR